jgi:hypothetical protein
MLIDIKHYLQQHHRAELTDIALYLKTKPDVVRPMMQHWMKKNKVICITSPSCSTGCSKCSQPSEVYEWLT